MQTKQYNKRRICYPPFGKRRIEIVVMVKIMQGGRNENQDLTTN